VEYYSEKAFFTGKTIDVARWNRFRLSPQDKDNKIRVYDLKEFFDNENRPGLAGRLQLIKGAYLYDNNQSKDALALLRLAQREYPDDPEVKYYIGLCHLRADKPQWTLKLFREIVDDPELRKDYREDCRIFVLVEDAIKLLGDKKHEEAVAMFEQALAMSPEHHTARFYLAMSLRALGRIEEAAAQARFILENNPVDQMREACAVLLDKIKS
jgi:tetratricopeptide (TPR) repeat protein